MSNEKEGSTVFGYKAPAIMITERNSDIEKVLEFATADDYAAYKRIEADGLIAAKYVDGDGVINVVVNRVGSGCHMRKKRI